MREELKLTPKEGLSIVWEDTDEFKTIHNKVVDTSRWSIHYEIIVERLSDNKYFKSNYSVGATEYQDERPYEYEKYAVFKEVFPVQKTITVFE
jgi:hypothetical protein